MNLHHKSLQNFFPAMVLGLALFAARGANAQDMAVSAALWHFPGNPGTFVSAGATLGLGPRLELSASIIPRLTPEAFNEVLAEAHLGLSLVGPRIAASGPVIYINTLLDTGVMLAWQDLVSGTPTVTTSAFLRLTPIALGNPFYGRRDKLLSFGLARDFGTGAISFFANILSTDIYLASGANKH